MSTLSTAIFGRNISSTKNKLYSFVITHSRSRTTSHHLFEGYI